MSVTIASQLSTTVTIDGSALGLSYVISIITINMNQLLYIPVDFIYLASW